MGSIPIGGMAPIWLGVRRNRDVCTTIWGYGIRVSSAKLARTTLAGPPVFTISIAVPLIDKGFP